MTGCGTARGAECVCCGAAEGLRGFCRRQLVQSTGQSLGALQGCSPLALNARQASCVFSRFSDVFPGDHFLYEGS